MHAARTIQLFLNVGPQFECFDSLINVQINGKLLLLLQVLKKAEKGGHVIRVASAWTFCRVVVQPDLEYIFIGAPLRPSSVSAFLSSVIPVLKTSTQ